MRTNAFIFARGGSKGLPRKNLLPLAGKPMLVHAIHLASQLNDVQAVYVSTDCPEISAVARHHGARLIQRPAHLSTDTAPEWLAWQHAVLHVIKEHGNFDRFLSLPTTAPLRSLGDVERCLDALDEDIDVVVTMTPARRSPWFNMVVPGTGGRIQLIMNNQHVLARRQDAPSCFDLTTVAYVSRPRFVLQSAGIWEGRVTGVEIPVERSIDIDTPLDFEIARFLIEERSRVRSQP